MIRSRAALALSLLGLAACSAAPRSGETTAFAAGPCAPSASMPLEGRASPFDSTLFRIGDAEARVCYGRPSVRDRVIFGELVPYDTLWRTGANEPTTLHLPVAAELAGLRLDPGSYSLYTVPGRESWQIVVNRAIDQWGHEGQYASVRDQEVGRATVPAAAADDHVETFTIRPEPAAGPTERLVLEWERTRVVLPVAPAR